MKGRENSIGIESLGTNPSFLIRTPKRLKARRMGKAEFYDRFLFILITTITAFLVSGIASTETNDEIKAEGGKDLYDTDKYNSMKIHYANYPDDGSDLLWKNMESYGNATKLSDDQFVDGKAFINLPSKYQLFGLNFNNVAVTKEGTIQSADRSVKWTIAPLKAKFGMTRCNISYFFQGYDLYVQWNNFRFSHKNFEKYDFSFQVRLGDKGEIDFVYKEVPFNLTAWREYCKCLGDNFGVMYRHEELFQVPPYIEFYELGFLMSLKKYEVKKGTVVRLSPADECMFRKSCDACTETKFHINPNETARCSWCPAIEKCSSRRDGFRDMWKKKKCDNYRVNVPNFCSFLSTGVKYLIFWYSSWL